MNKQAITDLLIGIIGYGIILNYNCGDKSDEPIDPYYYKKLYKPNHELQGDDPFLPNYSPSIKMKNEKSNEKE